MFTAALLGMAETWKPLRCPSAGEQIHCGTSRQWNTVQHQEETSFQAMKRHGGKLKCILLSKRSQSAKAMKCVIPTMGHARKSKPRRQWGDRWQPGARGPEGWIGRGWGIFRAVKNGGNVCQKCTEHTTQRVNPLTSYGLLVTACRCRLNDRGKCATLVWHFDSRGG